MTESKYLQSELEKKFDHLAEECGEFLSAYAKMRRWGAFSYNPELPSRERQSNINWVREEMEDIRTTLARVEENLRQLAVSDSYGAAYDEALEEAFPLYNE